MTGRIRNSTHPWTVAQEQELRRLARANTPPSDIAATHANNQPASRFIDRSPWKASMATQAANAGTQSETDKRRPRAIVKALPLRWQSRPRNRRRACSARRASTQGACSKMAR